MSSKTGVLILAGGKSERMIFPKAYLLFNGKTFLKKIIEEYYEAGIKNIYVVLNDDFCNGEWEKYIDEVKSIVTIIKNPNPELGRFHSLKLGI
jgi:CTP:molybdopterin cytidylyltransferase MocA